MTVLRGAGTLRNGLAGVGGGGVGGVIRSCIQSLQQKGPIELSQAQVRSQNRGLLER